MTKDPVIQIPNEVRMKKNTPGASKVEIGFAALAVLVVGLLAFSKGSRKVDEHQAHKTVDRTIIAIAKRMVSGLLGTASTPEFSHVEVFDLGEGRGYITGRATFLDGSGNEKTERWWVAFDSISMGWAKIGNKERLEKPDWMVLDQ